MRTQILKFAYETKHSVRFDAASPSKNDFVTSVYVLKSSLEKPYPQKIGLLLEDDPKVIGEMSEGGLQHP